MPSWTQLQEYTRKKYTLEDDKPSMMSMVWVYEDGRKQKIVIRKYEAFGRDMVEFKSPLRFGDEPEIEVTCFQIGSASLGLHYLYRLGSTVCIDAHMTTVCVHLDELKSTPIPDAYRAKFEEILETST